MVPSQGLTSPGTTTRASVSSAEQEAAGGPQLNVDDPAPSGDGRHVAFTANSGTLVPGDTNATDDVFVVDRETGAVTRVSGASNGAEGDGPSGFATISADGRYVTFES